MLVALQKKLSKQPEVKIRDYKRMLQRSIRDIERERRGLEQQEKKLIIDIKKMAKAGQMGAVEVMAKDLVRTRKYIVKFHKMKAQLTAVSLRVSTVSSTHSMAVSMRDTAQTMQKMNKQMNIPQMRAIFQNFERQSEVMNMKEEMMGDAVDDAFDEEGDEEEGDSIVAQVMDELGLNLESSMASAPTDGLGQKVGEPTPVMDTEDQDLMARMDNLRRS